MSTTPPLISTTFRTFRLAPLHFLLLQIPEVSLEVLYLIYPPPERNKLLFIATLYFPYLCISAFLSAALTFVSVGNSVAGQKPSFRTSAERVLGKIKVLIPVSLLVGLVLILGMLALVLPFLYFFTLYLFVPLLVMTEARMPWSLYLHKSKLLAKTSIWKSCGLVVFMLVLSFTPDTLVTQLSAIFSLSARATMALAAGKVLFSLFSTAIMGIWISYYFLELRAITKT